MLGVMLCDADVMLCGARFRMILGLNWLVGWQSPGLLLGCCMRVNSETKVRDTWKQCSTPGICRANVSLPGNYTNIRRTSRIPTDNVPTTVVYHRLRCGRSESIMSCATKNRCRSVGFTILTAHALRSCAVVLSACLINLHELLCTS